MEQSVEWFVGMTLDDLERHVILKAMNLLQQDIKAVARVLGRSHRTIENKLEQFKTEDEEKLAREQERLRKTQEYVDRARAIPSQFRGEFFPDHPPTYDEQTGKVISGGSAFKPPFETTKESEVSLSERSEVQEVLSEQTTVLREKRRR